MSMNDFREYSDYLQHYGVAGMKWGVRRYQNYDGSYTQKGLEHYRKAEAHYDEANARLKEAKKNKASKQEIKEIKADRKQAKKNMNTHYKLLKQDKLADEGKELYAKNTRITSNDKKGQAVTVGANIVSAAASSIPIVGQGAILASYGYDFLHAGQNKRLRAYYGHKAHPQTDD